MKNHQTAEILEKTLANSYVLQLKLQNYHWNVIGPHFKPLHELFEAQYNELSDAVDVIAERLRTFGIKIEATFDHFQKLSKIKPGDKNLSSDAMIKDLISSHGILVENLKAGTKAAQEDGDEASADLFISRTTAHEKAIWMLTSSL